MYESNYYNEFYDCINIIDYDYILQEILDSSNNEFKNDDKENKKKILKFFTGVNLPKIKLDNK